MRSTMLVAAIAACVAVSTAWGRSFSLDLRKPGRDMASRRLMSSASPNTEDGALRSFALDAGAADVGEVAVGDELKLTLFDDVAVALTLKKRMGTSMVGDVFLADAAGCDGMKSAVVLRTPDGLTVDVQDHHAKRVYKVMSTESGVMVRELASKTCGCGCGDRHLESKRDAAPIKSASTSLASAAGEGTTYVDILVVYDAKAASWVETNGGGITNFAQVAVQKMNSALANTDLDDLFSFRLAGVGRVEVSETDVSDALDAINDDHPGWKEIKKMRDEFGADIVTTLIDTGTDSGTTGVGWSLSDTPVSAFEPNAYNVCAVRSVAVSHTMTHEVGHNMGCGHATAVDPSKIVPGPQLFEYSAGYYFTGSNERDYNTIMAYNYDGYGNSYEEAPCFSSPKHKYEGAFVGDDLHDNTRTLAGTYEEVSRWRDGSPDPEELNDTFETALQINGAKGLIKGSCSKAAGAPCKFLEALYGSRYTVWFKWTAPNDGLVRMSLENTYFDSVMGVFTGTSADKLEMVVHNDDHGGSTSSMVTFEASGGVEYYISIGGLGDAKGDFYLEWKLAQDDELSVVAFDACGGDVNPTSMRFFHGKEIGSLPCPERKSYRFDGWYTSPNGGEAVDESWVVPKGEITLYARWAELMTWITRYTDALDAAKESGSLIFMVGGRETDMNTTRTRDYSCEEEEVRAVLEDYVLWFCDCDAYEDDFWRYADGFGVVTIPFVCVINPYKAGSSLAWSMGYLDADGILDLLEEAGPAPGLPTVRFDANGGDVDESSRKLQPGSAVGKLPVPVRDQYVFLGWYTDPVGGTPVTAANRIGSADIVFYAHWRYVGRADESTIYINTEREYYTGKDGSFVLSLSELVESYSEPTVTVRGLPKGLAYDAKTMTVSGKATEPGVFTVTVGATNKTVKKPVVAKFTITTPNLTTETFRSAGLVTDESYVLQAGVAPDLGGVFANLADSGWNLALKGLPSGLKYDAKKLTLSGTATKVGVYTVYFTATRGKEKEIATATFKVVFPLLTLDAAAYEDASAGGKVTGGGAYESGKKVTIKATPRKGSIFMGWYDGDELLSRAASYKYTTTAEDVTLTAKFITTDEDAKNVSASVSVSADVDPLNLSTSQPLNLTNVCGVAVNWSVAVEALSETKVKVSGLPSGLKFTAKDIMKKGSKTEVEIPANTIYGSPSAASKYDKKLDGPKPSVVKIEVTTAGKTKAVYRMNLTVKALPAWAVGTFGGAVYDEGTDEPGPISMTISSSGKVSGKYALLGTNWTFKVDSCAAADLDVDGFGGINVYAEAKAGKETRLIKMDLGANGEPWSILPNSATAAGNGIICPLDEAGNPDDPTAYLSVVRVPWKDKGDDDVVKLLASHAGSYSCVATYGEEGVPASFVLDEKGVIKGTAQVDDNGESRKISFSANALPLYEELYAVVCVPSDLKKGFPALHIESCIVNSYIPEVTTEYAFRDPGVVASVAEYTPESGASGTVSVNPKYGQVAAGKDVTLTAKADKNSIFACWEIAGIDTDGLDLKSDKLKFRSPGTNDVVAIAKFITKEEDKGEIKLYLNEVALSPVGAADGHGTNTVQCGVSLAWTVSAEALSKTTVKVAGLPAGLKFTAKDIMKKGSKTEVEIPANTVYGVPSGASKTDKKIGAYIPSTVKFTVTTAGKSSQTFAVDVIVDALPSWAVGTFDGEASTGSDPVGIVQALKIDAKGKISGKVLADGATWSLSAGSFDSYDSESCEYTATVVGKSGKLVMTNEVTIAEEDGRGVVVGGPRSSAAELDAQERVPPEWTAYQNLWKRSDTKASQPVFKKSMDVELDNGLKVTFKKDGVVAFAGTIDGNKVSGSSQLASDGEDGWKVTLYAPAKGAFEGYCETLHVTLTLAEDNVVTAVAVGEGEDDP